MPRNETRKDRPRLTRKFGIDYSRNPPENAPCQPIFDDFKNHIRRCTWKSYSSGTSLELRDKPWKAEVRGRAEFIIETANKLCKESGEEADWRSQLEHHIFARFEYEVTCHLCGAKLWKSEFQMSKPSSELEDRRSRRRPCKCNPRPYGQLNNLFGSRTENQVVYKDDVRFHVENGERPDRIYGLLFSSRLEKLVDTAFNRKSDTLETRSVELSPFAKSESSGSPLLFPFLVLESKSEVGPADEQNIFFQTAFAIRRLLLLQKGLCDDVKQKFTYGPFVWFLFHIGPMWTVAGAYISSKWPMFRVVRLLRADVTDHDGALRLLLAIDYIADWARDVYRADIVKQLKKLIPDDMKTLIAATEIESAQELLNVMSLEDNYMDPSISEITSQGEVPLDSVASQRLCETQFLEFFDTGRDSLRDMTDMHFGLYGLVLTEEKVASYLELEPDEAAANELARKLLDALAGGKFWTLTVDGLQTLERQWTGRKHDPEFLSSGLKDSLSNDQFMVQICIRSFIDSNCLNKTIGQRMLSTNWQQVHELSYVAISPSAVEKLEACAIAAGGHALDVLVRPVVAEKRIRNLVDGIRAAPAPHCLAVAIDRQVLVSAYEETTCLPTLERLADIKRRISSVSDLPKAGYTKLKKVLGRGEPEVRWLSASSWRGQQEDVKRKRLDAIPAPRLQIRSDEYAVLVHVDSFNCIFVRETSGKRILRPNDPLPAFITSCGPITSNSPQIARAARQPWDLVGEVVEKAYGRTYKLEQNRLAGGRLPVRDIYWHRKRLYAFHKHYVLLPEQGHVTREQIIDSLQQLMSEFRLTKILKDILARTESTDSRQSSPHSRTANNVTSDTRTTREVYNESSDNSVNDDTSNRRFTHSTRSKTPSDPATDMLRQNRRRGTTAKRTKSDKRVYIVESESHIIKQRVRHLANGSEPESCSEDENSHETSEDLRNYRKYRIRKNTSRISRQHTDSLASSEEHGENEQSSENDEEEDSTTLIADEIHGNTEDEDSQESSGIEKCGRRKLRRSLLNTPGKQVAFHKRKMVVRVRQKC